jgi:hypothetical protein
MAQFAPGAFSPHFTIEGAHPKNSLSTASNGGIGVQVAEKITLESVA